MNKITHNWAEHVAFGHEVTHFPARLAEVQDTVRAATKLRPIGSRHSFKAITVTVDGGITFAELCPVRDAAGWALFNLGSIPDFTIAGATATATHGSGNIN